MQQTVARASRWCARMTILFVAAMALSPSPAGAHAELDTITPADGSAVNALPTAVQLRFTEPVTSPYAVSVTGPSGRQLVDGRPAVVGERLVQKLASRSDGPGAYTVSWQVTSEDRHLVHGVSTFTLRGAGAEATGTATDPVAAARRPLVLALGAGLLLLLCVAIGGIGRLSRESSGG